MKHKIERLFILTGFLLSVCSITIHVFTPDNLMNLGLMWFFTLSGSLFISFPLLAPSWYVTEAMFQKLRDKFYEDRYREMGFLMEKRDS